MDAIIIFLCLGGIIYTLWDDYEREAEEKKNASEFMKSRHRVINPRKKDKDKK